MSTEEQRNFNCSVCQKSCSRCEELSLHLMTHSVVELAKALTVLQMRLLRLERQENVVLRESDAELEIQDKEVDQTSSSSELVPVKKPTKGRSKPSQQKPGSRQPQKCTICASVLSSRGALTKHMIIHQEKKPFQCQECSQNFNQARDLKTHKMQRHSNVRPHVCGICGKGFVHKSYLLEHMSYHTDERQFQCYHCGNRFQAQSALVKHMKRHTTSKDFVCSFCPKAFAVKTDLKSHIRLVHEKPQVSSAMKSSPTENICQNQTFVKTEEFTGTNFSDERLLNLESESVAEKHTPEGQDESLLRDDHAGSIKLINSEDIKDVISNMEVNDNASKPSIDDEIHIDVVKVTSAMLDKTEVKVLEDGGVTAVVGDQTFSQSTPLSPPDPTKESTPYIPNVPKV